MAAKATSADLAAQYGFAEAFFRSVPELWALFSKAVSQQWTPSRWQGEFMNTSWYRQHAASIRQWKDLSTRDPAEAASKIAKREAQFRDALTQLGANVDPATLHSLAQQSLELDWSPDQVDDILAAYVPYEEGRTGGTVASMQDRINAMAYDYGVDVTGAQMQDWLRKLVSKEWTTDNVNAVLSDSAKSKYAGLAPMLETGRTTRDIAGQHIAEFAKLMEVGAETVSLDDPVLAKALQGQVDPKTGVPQMQTVFEMSNAAKKDPRWLKTGNARRDMVGVGHTILRDMGLVS